MKLLPRLLVVLAATALVLCVATSPAAAQGPMDGRRSMIHRHPGPDGDAEGEGPQVPPPPPPPFNGTDAGMPFPPPPPHAGGPNATGFPPHHGHHHRPHANVSGLFNFTAAPAHHFPPPPPAEPNHQPHDAFPGDFNGPQGEPQGQGQGQPQDAQHGPTRSSHRRF
eukprot:gene10616-biopygen7582